MKQRGRAALVVSLVAVSSLLGACRVADEFTSPVGPRSPSTAITPVAPGDPTEPGLTELAPTAPAAPGGPVEATVAPPVPEQIDPKAPGASPSAGPPTGAALVPPAAVTMEDIWYEGYRNIATQGRDSTYGQGLTHRYVGADLRLLTLALGGVLHEVSLAGSGLGATLTQTTATWDLNPTGGLGDFTGLLYEQAEDRLWLTSATDYTVAHDLARVTLLRLGANGAVTRLKTFYLAVPAKRVYGGCQAVPEPLVGQLGGSYVCGWGGYASLVDQGGGASIGPTMYVIPDPDSLADGATAAVRTVLDASGSRGWRASSPVNYFDGGDPRPNPSSRPSVAPVAGAQWLSPNADGVGWMTWSDSYYNTGMWLGTTYAAVASLCQGSCWYQSSTLAFDGRQFELHLWDGANLGTDPLRRPDQMSPLDLSRGNSIVWYGNSPVGNIAGATYDPRSQRIYLLGYPFGDDAYTGRLYSYVVAP